MQTSIWFLYIYLQVYYELDEERKKVGGKDVAICRVEQLCPFPYDLIQRELKRYPSVSSIFEISYVCVYTHTCTSVICCLSHSVLIFFISDAEIVWCQEEPMNMGAYHYIAPRLCTAMKALGRGTVDDIKYVGRAPSAATATGFYQVHVKEQTEIIHKALQPDPIKYP